MQKMAKTVWGKKCMGKTQIDLGYTRPPAGTVIRDADSNEIIADLIKDGDYFIAAKEAGEQGLEILYFATSTKQVPMYAQPGEGNEERVADP